jgi:hypothetical protein
MSKVPSKFQKITTLSSQKLSLTRKYEMLHLRKQLDSYYAEGITEFGEHLSGTRGYIYSSIFMRLAMIYLIHKYNVKCLINQIEKGENKNLSLEGLLLSNHLSQYSQTIMINKSADDIIECINKTNEIFVIPFGFTDGLLSGHANLIVYRKADHVIEHYEPQGQYYQDRHNEIGLRLRQRLSAIVSNINTKLQNDPPLRYVEPSEVTPDKFEGLQTYQEQSIPIPNIEQGICQLWSIFMAEMVLMHPSLTTTEINTEILEYYGGNVGNATTIQSSSLSCILGYMRHLHSQIEKLILRIYKPYPAYDNIKNIEEFITLYNGSGVASKIGIFFKIMKLFIRNPEIFTVSRDVIGNGVDDTNIKQNLEEEITKNETRINEISQLIFQLETEHERLRPAYLQSRGSSYSKLKRQTRKILGRVKNELSPFTMYKKTNHDLLILELELNGLVNQTANNNTLLNIINEIHVPVNALKSSISVGDIKLKDVSKTPVLKASGSATRKSRPKTESQLRIEEQEKERKKMEKELEKERKKMEKELEKIEMRRLKKLLK